MIRLNKNKQTITVKGWKVTVYYKQIENGWLCYVPDFTPFMSSPYQSRYLGLGRTPKEAYEDLRKDMEKKIEVEYEDYIKRYGHWVETCHKRWAEVLSNKNKK
jgi:hypothetical protein